MKKAVLLILLAMPILAFSQDYKYKKIHFKSELGVQVFVSNNNEYENEDKLKFASMPEAALYLGYRLDKKNSLDLGFGISGGLPLTINWIHNITENDNTWFYKFAIGHNILFLDALNYFKYSASLGYRFKLSKSSKRRFAISAGYNRHVIVDEATANGFSLMLGYGF